MGPLFNILYFLNMKFFYFKMVALLGICFFSSFSSWASQSKNLSQEVVEIFKNNRISQDQVGFALWDIDRKKFLGTHNLDRFFIPASLTKLPSVLMSIETLGADFRFKTTLGYVGEIKEGELVGDLFLKGDGDPLLSAAHLANFVDQLVRAGIRRVKGNFYFDESLFPSSKRIALDMPEYASYNPGIGPLSAEFNRFSIWRKETKKRVRSFYAIPALPSFQIQGARGKLKKGEKVEKVEGAGVETWKVSSRLRKRREEFPVGDVGSYTAEFFRHLASIRGVDLPPSKPKMTPMKYTELFVHRSRPLIEIGELTLEYSNNVLAELLLRRSLIARNKNSWTERSVPDGFRNWLSGSVRVHEGSWEGVSFLNGSGLTSFSKVSPRQFVSILDFAFLKTYGGRGFWTLLPISGWKGWVRDRLTDPKEAFRVWAKTGSLDYSNALAGYFFGHSGSRVAFSIFVLDEKRRKKLTDLKIPSSHSLRKQAEFWGRRARRLQDDLLRNWLSQY